MSIKPNWYVSCSPRSPEKIQPELKELKKYDGQIWKGKAGIKAQESFAKDLEELDTFKGETFDEEKSFSARDRVAPMKTYGFVYIDDKGNLVITGAGKMLSDGKRPKDVFLKQLVKWQYPSVQHQGPQYASPPWHINPFTFVLRLIKKIDGISKLELAIFGLNVTNNREVKQIGNLIIKFREDLCLITGSNKRDEFIDKIFFMQFKEKFGTVSTIREGKSESNNTSAIYTKMRNAKDVADATFRYFRYTGLFSTKGNKLILNTYRNDEIDEIIELDYFNPDYMQSTKFHHDFGNPSLPQFSFESKSRLIEKIKIYHFTNLDNIKSIFEEFPNVLVEQSMLYNLITNISTNSLEELKDILYIERETNIQIKKKMLQVKFKDPKEILNHIEILSVYYKNKTDIEKIIGDNFIANKNCVIEYLILNSFIILGEANNYINNYSIDENLQPISHAAGNQSDIEIEYHDFIVLGEITTSKGATQFKMEGEPVTRHYINKRDRLKENRDTRTLYCTFIATQINMNTLAEFSKYNIIWETKIVPFTLSQFIHIINTKRIIISENKEFKIVWFRELLEKIINISVKTPIVSMEEEIESIINIWCRDIQGRNDK